MNAGLIYCNVMQVVLAGGQGDGKGAPLMEFTLGGYRAVMRFDNPLTDAEPKSSPSGILGTGLICPVKTVEYIRHLMGGNAYAAILENVSV